MRTQTNIYSITKIGVTAAVFLAVTLISYYLLSSPVESLLDAFAAADMAKANDEISTYMPLFRNAMSLFWSIFISLPVTWLVIKVLSSREPDTSFWRRR